MAGRIGGMTDKADIGSHQKPTVHNTSHSPTSPSAIHQMIRLANSTNRSFQIVLVFDF